MQQAHVFISGDVQGVGFRQFVKTNAKKFGLTGWVRNTPARQSPDGLRRLAGGEDGGVEIVVQGDKEKIEELIKRCKSGPFLAKVNQIGCEWEEKDEVFNDFTTLA